MQGALNRCRVCSLRGECLQSVLPPLTTNEKPKKRPRDEAVLENHKRRREEPTPPVEEPPAKVPSPPCPKPRLRPRNLEKTVTMGPPSSLTCPPSQSTSTLLLAKYTTLPAISSQDDSVRSPRSYRSEEFVPEGRGSTGDAVMHQKTSPTRLPDPVVQDACKLFFSVDLGKSWADAIHHFQDFETPSPL